MLVLCNCPTDKPWSSFLNEGDRMLSYWHATVGILSFWTTNDYTVLFLRCSNSQSTCNFCLSSQKKNVTLVYTLLYITNFIACKNKYFDPKTTECFALQMTGWRRVPGYWDILPLQLLSLEDSSRASCLWNC